MKNAISMKIFEAVLRNANLPVLMTGAATHGAARDLSAELVSIGAADELITDVIEGALPDDYAGNTLLELPGMIAGARKKGFAEARTSSERKPAGLSKREIKNAALELLRGKVELFHDGSKQYMSVPTDAGGQITVPIGGQTAQRMIRRLCYKNLDRRTLTANDLRDIVEQLSSEAEFDGPKRKVFRRFARPSDDEIYLDLGTDDGEVVQINRDGWSLKLKAPIPFIRDDRALPLPVPSPGGDIGELRRLLGLDEDNWIMLQGFLMNCFSARGPYFCLIVEGPATCGKTTLCNLVKKLIDPRDTEGEELPKDARQLVLNASMTFLPAFDNISWVGRDTSDALCRIATGAAYETRTLYTNESTTVIRAFAPVILNGTGEFANRADLLSRAIPLQMSLPTVRLGDDDLQARFESAWPQLLGALCDAAVEGLRSYDTAKSSQNHRMMHAVRWMTAAEPALGLERGSFDRLLARQQSAFAADRATMDPIFGALEDLTKQRPFSGTPTELHEALSTDRRSAELPRTAASLSRRLIDLGPQLAHAGLIVERGLRTAKQRTIIVRRANPTVADVNGPEQPHLVLSPLERLRKAGQ